MVPKGSIAIDGISLTVAQMDAKGFKVAIIPTTWKDTTFASATVGSKVNIETDILIKTIKKQLRTILPNGASELTTDKLKDFGF